MNPAAPALPPPPRAPAAPLAMWPQAVAQLPLVVAGMVGVVVTTVTSAERIESAPALIAVGATLTLVIGSLGGLFLHVIAKRSGQRHIYVFGFPLLLVSMFTGWQLACLIDQSALSDPKEQTAKVRAVFHPRGKGARDHAVLDVAKTGELEVGLVCFGAAPQGGWMGQAVRFRIWTGCLGGRWVRHGSIAPARGSTR